MKIPVIGGAKICWKHVAKSMSGMFSCHLRFPCIDGRRLGRDNKACRKRWIHSLDPKLRKGINYGVLLPDSGLMFGSRSMDHQRGCSSLGGS
jgi:hypothetical protein